MPLSALHIGHPDGKSVKYMNIDQRGMTMIIHKKKSRLEIHFDVFSISF
jgi:hypothetical protein